VVSALNSIGVTPRDLIAILQAIKASGSLHAELEIL
jgi:flagellar P-ring protein FlgI